MGTGIHGCAKACIGVLGGVGGRVMAHSSQSVVSGACWARDQQACVGRAAAAAARPLSRVADFCGTSAWRPRHCNALLLVSHGTGGLHASARRQHAQRHIACGAAAWPAKAQQPAASCWSTAQRQARRLPRSMLASALQHGLQVAGGRQPWSAHASAAQCRSRSWGGGSMGGGPDS